MCANSGSGKAVDGQDGRVLKVVEPRARPRPLVRGGDQAALHRVAVHVFQLLQTLLLAPDIQVVEAPLPDPIRAMKVHGGRQAEPLQDVLAPGELAIFAEIFEDEEGGAFFQTLRDARGVGAG